jgi:glycosyltransferase involved in cell wall biosynthesis
MLGKVLIGLALTGYTVSAEWQRNTVLSGLDTPQYQVDADLPVSVISPAFNEAKYIGGLIRSAQNQTYSVDEIIVADASEFSEGTGYTAEALGAKVVRAEPGNISASRNVGARGAGGDILIFADADVIFGSQFVESAVRKLQQGYAACHPREVISDSHVWNLALWGPQLVRPVWNTTRCVAVWREVYNTVGGYDEACNPITHRCREDLDFGRRILEHYGAGSIAVLGVHIAASARRYKKYWLSGWTKFEDPVRRRIK